MSTQRRFSEAVAVRNAQLAEVETWTDRRFLILLRDRLIHTYRMDRYSPYVVRLQQIIDKGDK